MKKQSNLSRLLETAGSHKYLTYTSWVLSAISALIALVPFYYIWKMIKEVLEVAPNFDQAQNLTGNGWMAVLFAVIAVLVYIAGLMCSHLGAFRIATNLRIQTILRVQIDTINILWLSFFNLQNHYKICAFPFFPAHPHGIGYRFLTCNFRLNGRFLSY